jgi:hypothetical protein
MVRPDDPHHAQLEGDVIAHATACGYHVGSATYHTVMPEPVRDALSRCWDVAALYIRGRADRVAVRDQRCILFEAKTNSGPWPRAAIEALPLSFYVRLGVPCLYVYRDVTRGFELAFWTTNLPIIDVIFLPHRFSQLDQVYRQEFARVWPGIEIQALPGCNGSRDPYVAIRRESLEAVAVDWRAVFASPNED